MENLNHKSNVFAELTIEIFRLNRLLLDAGDLLTQPSGLSSARWQVLGVVEHGSIPVSHVARIMGLTRQAVQQNADSLASDGLIVYSDNPHHRRAKLMSITPQGRISLDEVQKRYAEWANRLTMHHDLDKLAAALAELRSIKHTLEQDMPTLEDPID